MVKQVWKKGTVFNSGADPDTYLGTYLSADGSHIVYKTEPDENGMSEIKRVHHTEVRLKEVADGEKGGTLLS